MKNEITENKEFYIISRSIDNAEICKVVQVYEDCFDVKLNHLQHYETDEYVELFSTTSHGQLYFETIVKEVSGDIVSVWFPISSKYLQRREYSRISTSKEIQFQHNENPINARILDISAGGLKIVTKEQLKLLEEYKISLNIENKEILACFQPIRIEVINDEFVISGRFTNLRNYDRISLVQYCFRKQIENNTL